MNQKEFSELIGKTPMHVTNLKKQGRLVLNDDGSVNVEASMKLIEATASPAHEGVAEYHAKKRLEKESGDFEDDDLKINYQRNELAALTYRRAVAKTRIDEENAQRAEDERKKLQNLLLDRMEVEMEAANAIAIFRNRLESMPDIYAAQFAAEHNEEKIKTIWTDQLEYCLNDLNKIFHGLVK